MIIYLWKYTFDLPNKSWSFDKIMALDYATSVIWAQNFYTFGNFEIYVKASPELINAFSGNVFITRDGRDTVMYVEKVVLTTDSENGDYLIVSGRSAEIILNWRVILRYYINAQKTAENIMRDAIATVLWDQIPSHAIAPAYFPFLKLGALKGYADSLTTQFTGKTLYDIVNSLCMQFNYGFKLVFDGHFFTFELYKGTDRSYAQTENPYVIFSPEFENLGKTEYSEDSSQYANCAIVGGEGEGTDRTSTTVFPYDVYGMDLRQLYVDARTVSSKSGETELTPSEYTEVLKQKGIEALAQHKVFINFAGEILNTNSYTFGVDYGLGDKVEVKNSYGIKGNATVTGITEVEDSSGYRLVPTLSEWEVYTY